MHKDLQSGMDRFRAGLDFTYNPLHTSGRKAVNERNDPIHVITREQLSLPFIGRLIGIIPRKFLDQTIFWNASDLERKLVDFRKHYNSHRAHTALDDTTPTKMSEKAKPDSLILAKSSGHHIAAVYTSCQ